jgi:hypothetical protein
MSEPNPQPDAIEQANRLFWNPPSLDQLMADVAPFDPSEDFDIPGLSDAEWDVFERALAE